MIYIKNDIYENKIHNLSLQRKRGITNEENKVYDALEKNIMRIYLKGDQYFQENIGNIDKTSSFFKTNKQYYIGIYINEKDCKHNPYLFVYDRLNKQILNTVDYENIKEFANNDTVDFVVNALKDSLDNKFNFVSKENIDEMQKYAEEYDLDLS